MGFRPGRLTEDSGKANSGSLVWLDPPHCCVAALSVYRISATITLVQRKVLVAKTWQLSRWNKTQHCFCVCHRIRVRQVPRVSSSQWPGGTTMTWMVTMTMSIMRFVTGVGTTLTAARYPTGLVSIFVAIASNPKATSPPLLSTHNALQRPQETCRRRLYPRRASLQATRILNQILGQKWCGLLFGWARPCKGRDE